MTAPARHCGVTHQPRQRKFKGTAMKNAGLAWSTRGLAALVVTVAAIAGDFSLTGKEVGPVMKVLQDNGVQTVALHSHA